MSVEQDAHLVVVGLEHGERAVAKGDGVGQVGRCCLGLVASRGGMRASLGLRVGPVVAVVV